MEKDKKTTRDHPKPQGDVFSGICTLGVLSPDVINSLDVEDAVMVVIIDKRKRKHLRVKFPTQTIMDENDQAEPPMTYEDPPGSGCNWIKYCDKSGGDPGVKVSLCLGPGCPPPPNNIIYRGPCE